MSDTPNTAPAGAGEQQNSGPLDLNAAAGLLAELGLPHDEPVAAGVEGQEQPAGEAEHGAADPQAGEAAGEDDKAAREADPDAGASDEFAHGNARVRLRDGTVMPLAELKKLVDDAREIRAKVPEYTAAQEQLRQWQARAAQIAQQEQIIQTVVPLALARLQSQVPPEPDPALLDEKDPSFNPAKWLQVDQRRRQALAELDQLHRGIQAHMQQQQQQNEQARAAQLSELLDHNRKMLLEKVPELADETKRLPIVESWVSTAEKYGFSRDEVGQVYDARMLHMLHDLSRKAEAYDKLMAQREAAQQRERAVPLSAVPLQQPGRRVRPAEAAQQAMADRLNRLRASGGDISVAADILANI